MEPLAASAHIYEVFHQEEEGGRMRHAGNLVAPDDALAQLYARDLYGRRHESVRLWVVRREAVLEVSDPDLLASQFDHSYREGVGYRVTVGKRRELRTRVATQGEGEA